MFDYEVGKQVVCVKDDWRHAFWPMPPNVPVKDCVYTIRMMFEDLGSLWLMFEELRNPSMFPPEMSAMSQYGEPGFVSIHFRPVRKTSIEDIKKLCVDPPKAPVRVREDA